VIVPLRQRDGSLAVLSMATSAKAPTNISYELDVPVGGTARLTGNQTVLITKADGSFHSLVAPPWAMDANGLSVKTSYKVNGSTLTQAVEHRVPGVVYPVVADPWAGIDLISYFQWTGAGDSWAIHVHVTPMAGILWASGPQGPLNLNNAGWAELVSKAGSYVNRATFGQQFLCHAYYAPSASGIFGGNTTWDLEHSRGTTSNPLAVWDHQCNWGWYPG
jgi:hypothetical protein